MGSDPVPTLAKLKSLIASGQLHYVLLGGAPGGGLGIGGPEAANAAVQIRDAWIEGHGTAVKGLSASAGGATLYYF